MKMKNKKMTLFLLVVLSNFSHESKAVSPITVAAAAASLFCGVKGFKILGFLYDKYRWEWQDYNGNYEMVFKVLGPVVSMYAGWKITRDNPISKILRAKEKINGVGNHLLNLTRFRTIPELLYSNLEYCYIGSNFPLVMAFNRYNYIRTELEDANDLLKSAQGFWFFNSNYKKELSQLIEKISKNIADVEETMMVLRHHPEWRLMVNARNAELAREAQEFMAIYRPPLILPVYY